MAANLGSQIQGAAAKDMESYAQIQELMSAIGTEMAAAEQQREAVIIGNQMVSPESVRLENAKKLQTEARIQGISAAAGYSSDMSADIQAILMTDLKENALKMRATAQKIEQDASVSLWEDPGLALLNAFTLPWDQQELAALEQSQKLTSTALNSITAGVTNSAASARAIEARMTEAEAMEEQRLVENELSRQRKIGQINVLKYNIDGIEMAMKASGRQLEHAKAYNAWQNQEENQQLIRMQKEDAIAEKKVKEAARLAGEEAEQRMLILANLALAEAGKPTFRSLGEVKSKLLTAKDRQAFEDLVDRGRVLEEPTLKQTYRWGNTPQETIEFVDRFSVNPIDPDQKRLIDIVRQANAEAARGDKDKISGQPVKAEELVRKRIGDLEKVAKGDDTNPLRALTFGTLLKHDDVKSQKAFPILAEYVNAGNEKLSAHPEILAPVIAKAVSDRKISPDDAARLLNSVYSVSAVVNNERVKLSTITGMKQTKFIADIEPPENAFIGTVAAGGGTIGAAALIAPFHPLAGAAVLGLGTFGTTYLQGETSREYKDIDWMDFNKTRNIMVRLSAIDSVLKGAK